MADKVKMLPAVRPFEDKEFEREHGDKAIYKKMKRAANGEALLDEVLIEEFEVLLKEGNTRHNASRVIGVMRTTVAKWLKKGYADIEVGVDSLEARFTWMVDRCEGGQERRLVQAAMKAAMNPVSDGTLALKILERRIPEAWAPAIPEAEDVAQRYSGATRQAMRDEAKRVLQAAASEKDELTGDVVRSS